MFRCLICAVLISSSLVAFAASAAAAELRITFEELTGLVRSIAAKTKVYLNNAPGGLFTSQSYVEIAAAQQYPLPLPVKSFEVLGSTYGYYVNDIVSTSLRISSAAGALRLTIKFEADGPEAIAGCIAGECSYADVLPNIEWADLGVTIDFVPVQFQGSISLQVKSVIVSGQPRAVCKTSVDLAARAVCTLGLPFANRASARLKKDLPRILKEQVNQVSVQQQFADLLRKYLAVGQAGAVDISSVSIAPKNLTVDFRFSPGGSAAD